MRFVRFVARVFFTLVHNLVFVAAFYAIIGFTATQLAPFGPQFAEHLWEGAVMALAATAIFQAIAARRSGQPKLWLGGLNAVAMATIAVVQSLPLRPYPTDEPAQHAWVRGLITIYVLILGLTMFLFGRLNANLPRPGQAIFFQLGLCLALTWVACVRVAHGAWPLILLGFVILAAGIFIDRKWPTKATTQAA